MKSFLHIVAADLLSHFGHEMNDILVVLPSKRAGMFLARELALLTDEPVWAPQSIVMGDLFQSLTDVRLADPLECICQLHSVMQEVLAAGYDESLDEFWSWGEVLMADFDDIDKHLADARAIFTNIADQERLKNIDYLDEQQRETLKRFFGTFSLENSTRLQQKFLHTWSHMHDIYTLLHDRLLSEGKLWEGALFRHVVEQVQKDDAPLARLLRDKKAVVFAGFNVLGDAERTLMRLIQREGKARFYWDYDLYFCQENTDHEAGHFLRQNLRDFPSAITQEEEFDNFRHLTDVTFIACSTDNAAARYVNTWATEGGPSRSVVLAGEHLMLPVLHAIPEALGEVNVTMGFPIYDTPIYGLIMSLLKLQIEGYDAQRSRFRYPFVQTLQRQPLFELLRQEDVLAYHGGSTIELLRYLHDVIQQIARHYAQMEEPGIFEQLYSEVTFRVHRMLCILIDLCQRPQQPLLVHPTTLRRLFRQMLTSTKIPFHSEPDRGLQVMGMLETRCLDFDHILLLSAEEGNLPRRSRGTSFIPESLRDAFGLTTERHRICVYAYYFYRLASRCRHLTCLYNESTADGQQHEMSRFLRQMLAETDIPIRTLWLQSEPRLKAGQPLEVEKTPEVIARLRHRFDQNQPDGEHIMLSPSAINTYMACPMQFYLQNVLRIRAEDTPEEGISANIIGDIFHDSAEFFYEWLRQQTHSSIITTDMLCERKADGSLVIREVIHRELRRILHAAFDVCWFHPTDDFDRLPELRRRHQTTKRPDDQTTNPDYKGTTLIAHDVLLRYLEELIRYDARHAPFRLIGAEKERSVEFEVQGARLRVGGRIDRIDEMGGRLRVVDYKTGSFKPRDKVKMENVVSLVGEHDRYYLQTFLYALAEMEQEESSLPIQPVLFFPGQAAKPDYDPSLMLDGAVVDDFKSQHAEAFREGLQQVLDDIFRPDKPFTCARVDSACTYCKLGILCNKH